MQDKALRGVRFLSCFSPGFSPEGGKMAEKCCLWNFLRLEQFSSPKCRKPA